jgi:hypothetical protein
MLDPKVNPILQSIAMVAVLALVWGGVVVWRKGDRQKGVLMVIAAAVLLGNVLIWTL